MILSVLVFGFGPTKCLQLLNTHGFLFPQVQEEEPGEQPERTR